MGKVSEVHYLERERRTPFVRLFDDAARGTICPAFHVLAAVSGCPYRCTYCYLNHSYRRFHPLPTVYSNLERIREELHGFETPTLFNAGEVGDSFAVDEGRTAQRLLEVFREFPEHTLLLVTKATPAPWPDVAPLPNVILSWSVGIWSEEDGTPDNLTRLACARSWQRAGWRVRIRLDPLPDSIMAAGALAATLTQVRAERVTLGTLRRHRKPVLGVTRRRELYGTAIGALSRRGFPQDSIGLCKETPEMFLLTGLEPGRCNCTP